MHRLSSPWFRRLALAAALLAAVYIWVWVSSRVPSYLLFDYKLRCKPFTPRPAPLRARTAADEWDARRQGAIDPAACAFLKTNASVFMHLFPKPDNLWRVILDDEVKTIQHSVLAACGVRFYYSLPDGFEFPYADADRVFAPAVRPARARVPWHNEEITLAALYDHCVENPGAVVAYMHDKGARDSAPADMSYVLRQWDWRRLHEYYLLETPQGCVRALGERRWDTCGVNWMGSVNSGHYSGNFWWAHCDYVASLPDPFAYSVSGNDYRLVEYWVAGSRPSSGGRHFNCFSSGVNHHDSEFSRAIYAGRTCEPP